MGVAHTAHVFNKALTFCLMLIFFQIHVLSWKHHPVNSWYAIANCVISPYCKARCSVIVFQWKYDQKQISASHVQAVPISHNHLFFVVQKITLTFEYRYWTTSLFNILTLKSQDENNRVFKSHEENPASWNAWVGHNSLPTNYACRQQTL